MSVTTALVHPNVWIASLVGALVSMAASPLVDRILEPVVLERSPLIAFGALGRVWLLLPRPHSWQPNRWDAWKSTAMFVDIYPLTIIPACLAAGILGYSVISNEE